MKGIDLMNIQLSISLLASDRVDSLERCLDSLLPLMMKVPSELIVVFTSDNEKIYEIASHYTDQVIPFQWCGDFSAARNVGLKAAKGEWFMYIDDDEWFEDVNEICDFFLSGEYQEYGSACYNQRNYLDRTGIRHLDFPAFRIALRVPGLHFENPIHEEIKPRLDPCKYFHTYVHHYGYVKSNMTDSENTKPRRNIPILLKDIHKEPLYAKNFIQIVQEYCAEKNWDKAEEYCRQGNKLKMDENQRCWFQITLVDILNQKGNADQTIQEIHTILQEEKPCELAQLGLYTRLIDLHEQRKQSDKVIHYGLLFEKVLNYMKKNPWLWEQQMFGGVNKQKTAHPDELPQIWMSCLEAALDLEDFEHAAYFFNLLPWDNEYRILRYYPILDQWKKEYSETLDALFQNAVNKNPYLQFQKALSLAASKIDEKTDIFLQCLGKTESFYLKQYIIKEFLFLCKNTQAFVDMIELDVWKVSTSNLIGELSLEDLPQIWKTAVKLKETHPLYGLWICKLMYEKELIYRFLTGHKLMDTLSQYCHTSLDFYKMQYRPELFEIEMHPHLPGDCRFILLLSEGLGKMAQHAFPESVRCFRSALHYYPEMTGVINEVIRLIIGQMNNPVLNAGEEFQLLAVQMKETLRTMLEKGQYNEALSVLSQLSDILPADLELLRLRQRILRTL